LPCDCDENGVTRSMTMAVIHRLEIVDVDEQQRQSATLGSRRFETAVEFFIESRAVGHRRQRVVRGPMRKRRPLILHMAPPAIELVEQRVDVAPKPVELSDTEVFYPLIEAAVEPHVVRYGGNFIERLDELILESARKRDGSQRGNQQTGEASEQADADIAGERGRIAPHLDRADRRTIAADRERKGLGEEEASEDGRRVAPRRTPFDERVTAV